ncbi:hypothetical protein OSB04_024645 [Centaurea solstitialis]|uniref:CCHC-type domain-containing protein n=1 Tax=Centaurea solstitialis TaxID=347529 RepID=A0AA38SU14_9ASTR|nr:hypothetical protein OSB04_024645 [Centaurea solstitialis]
MLEKQSMKGNRSSETGTRPRTNLNKSALNARDKENRRKWSRVRLRLIRRTRSSRQGVRKSVAKEYPRCSGICYKCGKRDHMSSDCKVAAKSCFKCFQLGHFGHQCSTASVSSQLSCSVPLKAIEAS